MGQITERIQVIRLSCFRNAVDDRTGFCAIDTIDQLSCMFMQAEAAERSFCCIVIKRYFSVIQEHFQCLFLIDTEMDPFKCFPFGKAASGLHLFCPRKESLTRGLTVI